MYNYKYIRMCIKKADRYYKYNKFCDINNSNYNRYISINIFKKIGKERNTKE